MATKMNYADMLTNPDFLKELQKGLAMGQTISQTALQPEVTAEDIQAAPAPEPMYIKPETTNYIGFKDQASQTPQEPDIYEQMMSAQGGKAQQDLLYKLMSKSMKEQQAAADAAKQAFIAEKKRQEEMSPLQKIDLRPFAEAIRGYGATTVAPAEAPEMTEMQRQELLRKLQAQAESAQQGVTKEQVAALKNIQDQKNTQALLSQGNQDMRAFEAVQRKFDKPQQGLIDFYQSYDNFKSALDMGTTEAIQSATAAFARMSGEKGPLSDTDIQRVIPDNLKLKWAMYRQKILSGGSTPAPQEIIDALRKNLSNLKNAAETKYQTQLMTAKNQTAKGPGRYKEYSGSAYEEGLKILRPSEAGAASTGGSLPSMDAIQAERKRREAEKGKNK